MIDKLRYFLSHTFIVWGVNLIPDTELRNYFKDVIANAAEDLINDHS